MLSRTSRALVEQHDLVMFDLDGVVYVDDEAISGVPEHVEAVRACGAHVAFVTNNAARPPQAVVEKLASVGVRADAADVVTSAQAAAGLIRREHGSGATVVALGGAGLIQALEREGLRPVDVSQDDGAVALVSGYGPDVTWSQIMRAAVLVRDGLPYIASNTDQTIPTAFGRAPGHGVLVSTISTFAGVEPLVAGKPEVTLLQETIRRVGGSTPLMVGDRLDTDIEGAYNVEVPSLLVLTGVTGLREIVEAPPRQRPTYIAPDLGGLFEQHGVPEADDQDRLHLGGWVASERTGRLEVTGEGDVADWWRVVATTAWRHLDRHEAPIDLADIRVPGRAQPDAHG